VILYYAVGGGMGHLARASAVLNTLQIPKEAVKVLTASPFASLYFQDLPILALPAHLSNNPEFYEIWLKQQCRKYNFTEVWVDSFPCGILGELGCLLDLPLKWTYLARILHWGNYQGLVKFSPPFQRIIQLEPLELLHQEFINTLQVPTENIILKYPEFQSYIENVFSKKDWLIVHSEPQTEVEELLAYAQDQADLENLKPQLCLISPIKKTGLDIHFKHFDLYPSYPYFEQAGRIFTACGFNSMTQTLPFREKHHYLPFLRRFDNQFLRVTQHKKSKEI
jgi:hypothetical protein